MSESGMMKAVVFERYGGPERLSLREVPMPVPGPGEVRVTVHASTVGRTDTATLRAHPWFARLMTGLIRPKMKTLGMDFAGVIDAVGDGVSGFRAGERVFGMVPDVYGAHSEYVCLRADGAIAAIPGDLPFDEAVIGEGAYYAHGTAELLNKGDSCLIYGASGAIGIAVVQLAKARGAEVTAVVGTRHLEMAQSIGADRVINYEAEDFTAIGETFDLVMDAVGKTSWFACRKLLKPRAFFCATDLGPGWSNIWLSLWHQVTGRKRMRIPFPNDAPEFIRKLAGLMASGQIRGVFDRSYPLEEIAEAFRYVETGQKTGIVGVKVR